MRIVYISTYPPTHCGVGEYTRMLVMALKSINPSLEIHVFSNIDEGGPERYDEGAGAYIHPVYTRGSNSYKGVLDKLTEINGADIVHVQHEYGIFGYTPAILKTLLTAKDDGLVKKIVFTMHTIDHPSSIRIKTLEFQSKLNNVDSVIVHSILQEFELQNQGIEPYLIHRIPHGTLLNPYFGTPRFKLAEDLGLKEKELSSIVMTIPGFLRKDKGLDIILDMINYIGGETRFLTLIVAGELRDRKIKEIVDEISGSVNTHFIEKYLSHEEILKLIALADLVILPYNDPPGKYSVSGILHLAMGSLKPIVGTRVPRLIELYQFSPRLVVSPRNPRELARKILWLTENYDLAVAYMSSLYAYSIRTNWVRMARRHYNLYSQLLVNQY